MRSELLQRAALGKAAVVGARCRFCGDVIDGAVPFLECGGHVAHADPADCRVRGLRNARLRELGEDTP